MTGIVIAPFSNSGIRDWPGSHYRRLIELLLDREETEDAIHVIGTAGQRLRANEIVRRFPAGRVVSECGRLSWADMLTRLRAASCIVGNNSGITHLGGHFGVPTLCIFGGSHQRHEWRTLGPDVVLITRAIGCSPCQLDHGQVSPYDKACLRQIEPELVARTAIAVMRDRGGTVANGRAGAADA